MGRSFTAAELDARIPHVLTDGARRLICYDLEKARELLARCSHPEKWDIHPTTWDELDDCLGVSTYVYEDDSQSESFVTHRPGTAVAFDLIDGPFQSRDEAFQRLGLYMEAAP